MTGFLWGGDADAFFADKGKSTESPRSPKPPSPGGSDDSPLTVSQLNAWIKRTLDQSISSFWLAGEISNVMQSNAGHVYLTLKDDTNQISAVIWRSTWERYKFDLREGLSVLCSGKLDVYGPRGAYQMVVSRIEQQGLGPLQIAFRKLHAKLEAEGLFRSDRKRPLPRFPERIGFVTSPRGAAIHDFLEVLRRRWPQANVLVIPSRVQGEGAALEIAHGIALAGKIAPPLDVLIVGRGGGSIEDLWAFNEEVVVRALANCPIPTVSAVGHEIDVTLCDLAADVRALTPSEAAERVVPSRDEIIDIITSTRMRLALLMGHKVRELDARLTGVATRPVMVQPERMLDTATQRIDDTERKLRDAITKSLDQRQHAFEKAANRLDALSPLKTLARGYSITTDRATGALVTRVADSRTGQTIVTRVADGQLESQITGLIPNP